MQPNRLNILFVMVDQLRSPISPEENVLLNTLPGLSRIHEGAVSFKQHYTAANACRPARAALLTGLYTHQTGCLLTYPGNTPILDSGFPTWGRALQRGGYHTSWYGKWHLSGEREGEDQNCDLTAYGFQNSTCARGFPAFTRLDPFIADAFIADLPTMTEPWCSAVSLINPHDISWYYQGFARENIDRLIREVPSVVQNLPANFETPDDLQAHNKPSLQRAFQTVSSHGLGEIPYTGPRSEGWIRLLDVYFWLTRQVDQQIERVLDALDQQGLTDRTLLVFTSDHGEYGGSHGLRGKACAAYEPAIRVPLFVKDPTGQFTRNPEVERDQLTSSVDVFGMLLGLAGNGSDWRTDPETSHLANRLDMLAILADPSAPGRDYVLHTSDEQFVEAAHQEAPLSHRDVPPHVIAYRRKVDNVNAKFGLYAFWGEQDPSVIKADGQETECYDYSTHLGRLETQNVSQSAATLCSQLHDDLVQNAIPNELRRPLPARLHGAQSRAWDRYRAYARQHHFR